MTAFARAVAKAHLGVYAVEGQMAWDGVIELTSLTVDPVAPTGGNDDLSDDER